MLHKAPGRLQVLPSDYRFPPQLVPAFHADLRHRLPTTLCYSALRGYPLWIGRPFRRGGANIDFVLYNAKRQYTTDIQ